MLYAEKHGQRFLLPTDGATESGTTPGGTRRLSEVAPGAKMGDIARDGRTEAGLSGTDAQSFGYMMPEVDGMTGSDVAAALKALAEAMTEAAAGMSQARRNAACIIQKSETGDPF